MLMHHNLLRRTLVGNERAAEAQLAGVQAAATIEKQNQDQSTEGGIIK